MHNELNPKPLPEIKNICYISHEVIKLFVLLPLPLLNQNVKMTYTTPPSPTIHKKYTGYLRRLTTDISFALISVIHQFSLKELCLSSRNRYIIFFILSSIHIPDRVKCESYDLTYELKQIVTESNR